VPLLLRKIRKNRWFLPDEGLPYLLEGEIPADPLVDLATSANRLSVWYIEADRSNLERVQVALASNGEYVSNFDYALFEDRLLEGLNVKISQTVGSTPDESANVEWHRDVEELSASKLAEIAKIVFHYCEKARVPEIEVAVKVRRAIESGQIVRSRLNGKFLTSLDKDK